MARPISRGRVAAQAGKVALVVQRNRHVAWSNVRIEEAYHDGGDVQDVVLGHPVVAMSHSPDVLHEAKVSMARILVGEDILAHDELGLSRCRVAAVAAHPASDPVRNRGGGADDAVREAPVRRRPVVVPVDLQNGHGYVGVLAIVVIQVAIQRGRHERHASKVAAESGVAGQDVGKPSATGVSNEVHAIHVDAIVIHEMFEGHFGVPQVIRLRVGVARAIPAALM